MKTYNDPFIKKTMVLSSKLSLKLANDEKKEELNEFILEYNRLVKFFIHRLWEKYLNGQKIQSMFKAQDREKPYKDSWLLERPRILAVQQASAIVRGIIEKIKETEYRISVLEQSSEDNEEKQLELRKLQNNLVKSRKEPKIKTEYCSLSSKVLTLEKSKDSVFNYWVVLHDFDSREKGKKIYFPLKSHRHFNDLSKKSQKRLGGIILRRDRIQVNFELKLQKKSSGIIAGVDIGENSLFHVSSADGSFHLEEDKALREQTFKELNAKVSRKKFKSKGFKRAEIHRQNYINEQLNRINTKDIQVLRRENIYNFRNWRYQFIFDSLDTFFFKQNVFVEKINPRHTSQRCSLCNWTQSKNRNGERFRCLSCGAEINADENASRTIAEHRLPSLSRGASDSERGYFWSPGNDGRIAPLGSPSPKNQREK